MNWQWKNVLVTGGASFIGSHLVEKLVSLGVKVRVADNLSSGRLENLDAVLSQIDFIRGDLKDKCFTENIMKNPSIDIVFHLAASHGGRGYIHSHPTECCTNMILDQLVFEEAYKAGVDKVCFASSACVYPSYLQEETGSSYLLKEEDANPFIRDKAFADLEYGWAKLMGEMSLSAYHRQFGMKTCSVRIFTAYGPRENETHAIIALIAKAFIKMDPYIIWGTGEQDRNFTYVQDIVDALILAAEKLGNGSAVNAGRDDRISINKAAELIFDIVKWRPKQIKHDLSRPQGVTSRAADLTKAKRSLGWEPKVSYEEGFRKTIEMYFANKHREEIKANLTKLLNKR